MDKGGRKPIHGMARRGSKRSREYTSWDHMKRRCHNPKNVRYSVYGAKGITVCPEWLTSFAAFFEHVGKAPSDKHTLDRYPNKSGNYEPGNVRWATPTEQARNTKKNRLITYKGETLCVSEWAERTGVARGLITNRLNAGWSVESAITEPSRKVNLLTKSKRDQIKMLYKSGLTQMEVAGMCNVSRKSVHNAIYK